MTLPTQVALAGMSTIKDIDIIDDDVFGFIVAADTRIIGCPFDDPVTVWSSNSAMVLPPMYWVVEQVKQIM